MSVSSVNTVSSIASASIMSSAGAAIFLLLPVLIGTIIDGVGYSAEQAGLLSSCYFAAYLITGVSAFFWIRRVNWRRAALLAYILLVAGLLLSGTSEQLNLLLIYFFITGVGAGMLFGLGVTIISDTETPDRNYGWVLASQQLLAALLFLSLPTLVIAPYGFPGLVLALAAVMFLLSLSIPWVPVSGAASDGLVAETPVHSTMPVKYCLVALMIHFTGLSAVWAFIERFAVDNQLENIAIGNALAIAMLGGLFGGLAAALAGDRWGQRKPLVLSTLFFIIVFYCYATEFDLWLFTFATLLFSFMWNYVLAYQMGILVSLDTNGRYAVLMPAAQAMGAMLGPLMGGFLLPSLGTGALLLISGIVILLAIVVFVRSVPTTQAVVKI